MDTDREKPKITLVFVLPSHPCSSVFICGSFLAAEKLNGPDITFGSAPAMPAFNASFIRCEVEFKRAERKLNQGEWESEYEQRNARIHVCHRD
jgi:hypothetical protein